MEKHRADVKAVHRRSNIEKELEMIEQKQHDLAQSVQAAVSVGITKAPETPPVQNQHVPDDEFGMLFE
jgi:flagellar biosynthesis chaperone FliJ